MNPIEEWWSFFHTNRFDTDWEELGLGDEDLARLQRALVAAPEAGAVVAGAGGLRKLRFARPGEGKSGSLRVGYALIPGRGLVLLMVVYGKNTTTNFTPADKRDIKRRLEQLKAQVDPE